MNCMTFGGDGVMCGWLLAGTLRTHMMSGQIWVMHVHVMGRVCTEGAICISCCLGGLRLWFSTFISTFFVCWYKVYVQFGGRCCYVMLCKVILCVGLSTWRVSMDMCQVCGLCMVCNLGSGAWFAKLFSYGFPCTY
jgi:hypothetical protein